MHTFCDFTLSADVRRTSRAVRPTRAVRSTTRVLPRTSNLEPEPGTWNPEPGTRNPEPAFERAVQLFPVFATRVLEGQAAIVTGGGTGIGLAIARALGQLGARIVIASRSEEHRAEGQAVLDSDGIESIAVPVDVRDPAQVDAMVSRTIDAFGKIDILINNAAGNFICRAEDLSPNGWNAVIGIVLNGSFYCSRAVGRHLIARQGGGSIVSILANYAWTGSAGTIHSASAKAGVMAMTQTLAAEWGRHGIRVNAVAPGPVVSSGAAKQLWVSEAAVDKITESVPLRRWARTSEIADAVSFLVSPHAGYVTGEVLTVDGGQWLNRGTFGFLDLPR
jgi:NAD(P)-dependent dehydrogenase (short-subunit alcohol dehydrogenase family)